MKLPKFLLCENPVAEKSEGRLFILYTGNPIILAEVFHFEPDDIEEKTDVFKFAAQFDVAGQLDYPPEYIVFGAVAIYGDIEANQKSADHLAGIMRRMADWYKSYLIWEERQ